MAWRRRRRVPKEEWNGVIGSGPQPSIACPSCGKTSYHPKDIEHKYCDSCKQFHSQMDAKEFPANRDEPEPGFTRIEPPSNLEPTKFEKLMDGHGKHGEIVGLDSKFQKPKRRRKPKARNRAKKKEEESKQPATLDDMRKRFKT